MKFNKKKFLELYRKKGGNVSATCDAMSIARSNYYKVLNSDPKFEEAIKEVNESLIDFAESMLMSNIKDGKETSIIFFLKSKGKDRGYIEKQEVASQVNVTGTIHNFNRDVFEDPEKLKQEIKRYEKEVEK